MACEQPQVFFMIRLCQSWVLIKMCIRDRIFALCGGIGATVALASFAGLQNEVDLESCPRSFRGIPIQLITAGLMAMALVGYYGLHLD